MVRRPFRFWALLAGALTLLLSACGSTDTTPVGTPMPTINVTITAAAGYKTFISRIFPYAATYPSSWQVQDDASAGNIRADVFAGPRVDNYTTNINVQAISTTADNNTFFNDKLAEIKTQSVTNLSVSTRSVAQQTANVVEWHANQPNFNIIGQQVIFVKAGRAWIVSLSASPTAFADNSAIFDAFLDSMVIVS